MKLIIASMILSFSTLTLAASLRLDVFQSDVYCKKDYYNPIIKTWDKELGVWEEFPKSDFIASDWIKEKYHYGISDSIYFPPGQANYLKLEIISNAGKDLAELIKFNNNADALSFKELIIADPNDFIVVHMTSCNAILFGRLSTNELANADHFIE